MALCVVWARAETPSPTPPKKPTPTPSPAPKRVPLTYKAPKSPNNIPRQDVDAGTRGWSVTMPSLYVLAPDHTGLTTRGQPSLYWYQSGPTETRIELTIIEPNKPKWILRVRAEKTDQGGIHRVRLERYNVTLAPGVVYKWTVALVPDGANRSRDLIASDTIQRIEPDGKIATALSSADGLEKAAIYAREGIWYDALEAVSNEIDAQPKDQELRRLRASLLRQVGLKGVASNLE